MTRCRCRRCCSICYYGTCLNVVLSSAKELTLQAVFCLLSSVYTHLRKLAGIGCISPLYDQEADDSCQLAFVLHEVLQMKSLEKMTLAGGACMDV